MFSIAHICIATNNIEETSKFYNEVLGFEITGTDETEDLLAVNLVVDGVTIEVLQSKKGPMQRQNPAPIDHLAFYVDNFDEEYERLKRFGVTMIFDEVRFFDGKKFMFFSGPNGERIEIMEK